MTAARDRRRRPSSCGGFTLIEMIIVMTATTAMTVTGAVMIGLLLSAETKGAEALLTQTSLTRLSQQLRADAHAAMSAAVSTAQEREASQLDLTFEDGRTARYLDGADGVLREALEGDKVTSRELFRLTGGETQFLTSGDGRLIELVHTRPFDTLADSYSEGSPTAATREMRIQAALGWDGRYESQTDEAGEAGHAN